MSASHLLIVTALRQYLEHAQRTPDGQLTPAARADVARLVALAHDPESLADLHAPQTFGERCDCAAPCHCADWSLLPLTFAEEDWTHDPGPRSQNRWKHVKTGRIVYAKSNPGASKKKAAATPTKATKKPTPARPTLDSARAAVTALQEEGGIDALALELAELHNTDLQTLKKELKVKAGGTKAVQALALARAAYQAAKGGGGEAEKKPPVKEKKPPVKKPQKKPPLPPPPPPEKEPEPPPPKQRKGPPPPEPGFTGTDTLGRRWVNGELQPGEPDPPALPKIAGGMEVKPGRKLALADLAGGSVPHVSDQDRADLEALDFVRGGYLGYSRTVNDYNVGQAPPGTVKRLQDAGYLEPMYSFGGDRTRGAQQLTPRGTVAAFLAAGGTPEVPDPTTRKGVRQLSSLFKILGKPERKKVLEHFGITRQVTYSDGTPREYDSGDLQKDLEAAATAHHAAGHVATRVRAAKDIHAVVNELAAIDDEGPLAAIKARQEAMDREVEGFLGHPGQLFSLEYGIGSIERLLNYKNTRGKKALREKLAKMKDLQGRYQALVDEKGPAREAAAQAKYEKVSELLRGRVKDPVAITMKHEPDVTPQTQRTADRAAALLQGVLQKTNGSGSDTLDYTTYRATKPDGTPDGRAHCKVHSGRINAPPQMSLRTGIHEIGHMMETNDPDLAAAIQEFRRYRIGDEKGTDIGSISYGEMAGEIGYKDNFDRVWGPGSSAYYVGKVYSDNSTEMLSMGLDRLYMDQAGFCQKDPEFAVFLIGLMSGELRGGSLPQE